MMKKAVLTALAVMCLWAGSAMAGLNTEIYYEITDLGLGRWQYTYDVRNLGLVEGIEEFTIWFGINHYADLAIETQDPSASTWDEIVWQPEPVFSDDGGYDALATGLSIQTGESIYGFSVSFDWMGTGDPGSQFYEIVIPNTSPMIVVDSGWTIPEPETLFLVLAGIGIISKKQMGGLHENC
jgi:hypothetical protein